MNVLTPADIRCFKILIAFGVVAVIITLLVFLIMSYRNSITYFAPKLSRKTVKSLYLVNSSRVGCFTDSGVITGFYYLNEEESKIYFNVSFIDWMWFCYKNIFHRRRKQKKELVKSQKENLAIILEGFQKDIEKLQKQSEKEIQDSKKIASDVLNRMK